MSKASKITIIFVVAILLILGIVGLIFLLKPAPEPDNLLTQRLDTPKNITLDQENWVLSYSKVENAERYEVFVNDFSFLTDKTSVDVSQYITECGMYTFQVRAIYSIASYNSFKSDTVFGYKYDTLSTPVNLSWGEENVLYWSQVSEANSYNILIKFANASGNIEEDSYTTEDIKFNFNSLLTQAPYSELSFFTIQVQASANDGTGITNPYIKDSAYSEEQVYYKISSIDAPVIRLSNNNADGIQQTREKMLYWNTDFAVQEYLLYVDGFEVARFDESEFIGQNEIGINLTNIVYNGVHIADTLGDHKVYVVAVPKSNEYYVVSSQTSNSETFKVVHKLSTVNVNSIKIYKEGGNLVITWDPVKDIDPYNSNNFYEPTSYNLIIWANPNPQIENSSFAELTPITELLFTKYTKLLTDLQAYGKEFKVQIQAVRENYPYVYSSDYCIESAPYSAVTSLKTPDNVVLNDANGVYTLTWRAVEEAQAGYLVNVYSAVNVDGNIQLSSTPCVSQITNETRMQISDYMNANSTLQPGYYAVQVITLGSGIYYTDSAPSNPIGFDYKIRLTTPTITSIVRAEGTENKRDVTITWTYVPNAQKYYININNIDAVIVEQPQYVPDNGLLSETTLITQYLNRFDQPNQYKITVQAVVTENLGNINYINSLPSRAETFVNTYKHETPTNMFFTQKQGKNEVLLEWTEVKTVTLSNGRYNVYINDVQVTDLAPGACSISDIGPYLKLGYNEIRISCAGSGQLYTESDVLRDSYVYNYTLTDTSKLEFSLVNNEDGSKQVQILIPGLKYVTNYYLVFSNGRTLSVATELDIYGNPIPGADARVNVDFTVLPLFTETTITVYAGKINETTNQANMTPNSWDTVFLNNLYMASPQISYNAENYTVTIQVADNSLQYTQNIEWRLTGTTGVNYRDYISDFSQGGIFTFNLKELNLINEGENILVGSYNIYATAISNQSNNLRSEEASETFTLTKPLPNPTNFVQADDNSYLQWDAVANSAGYEVLVNNQVVTTNLTEYTVADGNLFKSVIRLDTTSILNSAGSYEFKVKALAKEGSYYTSNENYTTHTWTFNNKLNAPTVSVVDYNNSKHLAIFYNNLVSNYTIVSANASLNETIEAVSVNGYVYYNLDNYFKTQDLVAGKYSIQVTANPKDSKYQSSDATTVEFVWKKQFETPTITVTQDFDADTMLIDWQDMIAQTLQGEVTPAYYQITISTTSGRVIVNKAQVNESQYVISGETLLANDSEYYFVDVCAIADIDSVMLDGYSNSVKFSYQKRLAKPEFATSVYSLTDNETINITANNLDTNANQLDILVELLNSEGGVESSKTFNGISWNYSGFEITGNSHLTDRGIYRISVRNVQNKQYATSAWSDPIYVYYAQTFEVAQDITISIDETNNVTVNFTKPTVPTLSNITAYNATVSYNNAGNKATQSIESIVGNSFSFAGDENWAAALSAKRSRITIVIVAKTTAITCAPSGLGFDTFNFAPESTTEYSFVIGAMNDPSDITMTVNGRDVTISWKGDTRYTDNTYIYSISLIDGQGQEYEYATNTSTKEQSVTLTLDEVYAIYFTIRSENGVGADKVSSFDVKKLFINTQDIASINDFDINYDGAFKATWTSVLPESSAFVGAKYILTINGTEFEIETASLEYSGKSVVLTMSAEMMAVALSSGRTATWSITTTDATYTSDKPDFTGQTVVAYRGNISVGTINNIPVVLSEAPTSLNIVGTLASWSAVTYATKYQLYVSNSEGGEVLDGRSVIVSSTSYDITSLVSGLTAGSYYIVVKVAEDTENKVYLANYVNSTSAEYLNRTPANSVTSLSILTIPAGTTFSTTITWKYTKNARFTIYLTNSSGDISYIAQNFGVGEYNLTFTEDNSQGDGSGTYTFSYLNGTSTDPTRKMLAGEYVLSVVVCGSGYFDDSAPANAVFVNKFALTSIESANLFSILPEFYLNNEDYTAELEKYENAYGFNTKFFIINDATLSYATHFNVYVLDTSTSQYVWVGKIKNEQIADSGTKLTFELISSAENKIMLSNIIAGTNSIKIVPWGDENYYFYVQNGVDYPLAQSENELASVFNVDLYLREEAPLLNALSIDATYTDSPTNTNISEVAIVFRNAQIGSTYRVTPYYDSNYDNSTNNECAYFDVPLTEDDFANGIPLGIKVFDKIRAYGPHNYYFTVQTLARNEFYLDSYVSKTDTTKITLKTRLIEFAPYSITGSSEINSLVTEVTENNADEIAKNGSIYWTLPKHAYSIDVKYTVTLVDESQSSTMLQYEKHYKSYSAYLKIIVDASNAISYQIVADENSYFILDAENNRMIFDMRAYFEDRERIKNTNGEATGTYYLAGTYFYMIEAQALGENQEPVDGVIFSPVNTFGTTTEMKPYTYQGIPYPIQPEATLSSDGILTWTFSDYIYGESAEHFGIAIRNYTDVIKPGTEQDYIEHIEYVDNVFELDLTPWLIAGGKDRNEVFIFTVAPNSYYYNSEYVAVDATQLQSSSTLPTIGLEWGDHREITAVLNPDISDSIYNDIVNNDYKVWIEVSLLKLSGWEVGDEMPTPGQNYDDVKQTQAYEEIVWNQSVEDSQFYNYINYQHRMTKYDFNLVSEINYLVDNLKITNVDNWLSARDSLSGGYYYIKVSLVTSSPYYSASVVTGEKMVREVWRSTADGATIEGQYLTTKTTNTAAQPIEGYDRLWGEAQFKEANLTFTVQTIEQKIDGVTYYRLPSTITVTARLYMGLDYDTDNYYTHTYNIPDPSLFGTSDIYYNEDLYPDVMISRCFIQGNEIDYSKVQVTIDIHLLFDANINAGVYHIFWVLDGDEVGDSSPINDPYKLSTEVCHYVILPTPILDYRLSYTGTNSSQYVINWILTPDKYTYTVNESCSYNINLFAFEEINGKYACDVLYDSLSPEEQKRFLDAEYQIEYFANNTNTAGKLIEYNQDYFLNGRQCYIQQPTSVNFNLVPNKNYKIFIYLSQKDWMLTGDLNDLYYLNSDTSVGVEYVYKKVSGVHSNTSIMPTIENVYPVENTVNMENNNYYTIVSDQPDLYNNAFEFYVYNTQDPVAGTDREWMKKQEEQGTYLAHWIIGTLNNAYPTGDAVEDLYILYDYQDRDPTSGRLATERSVGTLDASGHITLDQLTLSELLQNKRVQGMEEELDKVLVPINYYCRLKTWINNNEINSNAPLDDAGYYEDDVIYSKKWIRAHVPYVIDENGEINEELVDNFYNTLKEKQFTIEFLDMNVLNPSIYFVFRHNIQYAEPTVSYIEIFNKDGSSDYVNYSSLGKTDGYIIATSDSGYYYKIWLDNVYTTDPLIRNDKVIEMSLGYTFYDENDGGSSGTGSQGNEWQWTTPVRFVIHYVDDPESVDYGKAYILLAVDSQEAGASEMFTMLDERLPNYITIRLQAVTNANRIINDGGLNTQGEYLRANSKGEVLNTKDKINRIYVDSVISYTVNDYLSVKKQYTAPEVTLMFDTMTPILSYYTENLKLLEIDGALYKTNIIESGDYVGLASNPYIYTTKKTLQDNGGQYFEYGMLKTDKRTNYLITLKYTGLDGKLYTKEITLLTYDVNRTCIVDEDGQVIGGQFYNEVNGKDTDEARFDYVNYVDIYNYVTTCLYKAMYDLINEADNTPTSSGQYHGGLIGIDIQTIAPTAEVAPANLWVTSDTRTGYEFYFYSRLETVKTNFQENLSECSFDTYSEEGMPSFYTHVGQYFYYHSYIPYHYESISRDVSYNIYLDREGNMSYDIYNSRVKDACTIRADKGKETNTWNIKNLTDILKIDLGDPSIDKANYNQWRLPESTQDRWHMNIVAVVDDSMSYVGRGFNSKDLYYIVKLKIKNDIVSLSINMGPLANQATGTVAELNTSTLLSTTNGVLYNYKTSSDSSGYTNSICLPYNAIATHARLYYYYPYKKTNSTVSRWFAIDQSQSSRYYQLLSDFINEIFVDNPEIRGSDNFKLYIQFHYEKPGDLLNSYIEDSVYSVALPFNYYRQLTFDTSKISFYQSGSSIYMSAQYSVNNQFQALKVTINQYDLNNRFVRTQISTGNSGGSIISYWARGDFSYNYADCFDTRSRSSAEIQDMISGYKTAYLGYVQGGLNQFTVTPIHDGYEKEHNLLVPGITFTQTRVNYTVLIHPSAEMSFETDYTGNPEEILSEKWQWEHDSSDAVVEKRVQYGDGWGFVSGINTSFDYMKAGSMKASWTYRFDIADSVFTEASLVGTGANLFVAKYKLMQYGDTTGSTSSTSGIPKTPPKLANYFSLTITTYCKPGFGSVFSGGGTWTVSDEVTAEPLTGTRVEYPEKYSISSFITSREVTSGSISSCSIIEGALNGGSGANRSVRASVKITCDYPEGISGFRAKVSVSANISCSGWAINGTSYMSASASGSGTIGDGTTTISCSGSKWETDFQGCKVSYGTLESGSASVSVTGRA